MDRIDNVLETVFTNKYASVVLTMFLVFYSGLAAPKLPNFIRDLFENPIFRILVLSLIVYKGNKDPQLAIMIAVGFTVTMNFVSSQKFFENFSNHGNSPHSGDNTSEGPPTPYTEGNVMEGEDMGMEGEDMGMQGEQMGMQGEQMGMQGEQMGVQGEQMGMIQGEQMNQGNDDGSQTGTFENTTDDDQM